MTNEQLELYKNYQYRVIHIRVQIKRLEDRLMRIRSGNQALVTLVKYQRTARAVKVSKSLYPNRLVHDLNYLRNLLNSERYQLYFSYYQTFQQVQAKIQQIENRLNLVKPFHNLLCDIQSIPSGTHRRIKVSVQKKKQQAIPLNLKLLKNTLRDLEDVMAWLESGRPRPPRRNINRRSRIQNEIPFSQIEEQKIEKLLFKQQLLTFSYTEPNTRKTEIANRCLKKLSPREQEAYVLYRAQGLKSKEIARLMHCEIGTVEKLLSRAQKKIQSTLQTSKLQLELFSERR